jgi:hypothetical protein
VNKFIWAAGILAFGAAAASAQDTSNPEGLTPDDMAWIVKSEFSPYAGRDFPTRPLFGDTHLHTAISVDAGTVNRLGQEDAYRFARGEEVISTGGLRAKLSRPLDFLVISDHAEMYGLMPQLLSGDPEVLANETGRSWHNRLTGGDFNTIFATAMEIIGTLKDDEPPIKSESLVRKAWHAYTALADRYNDPGSFTTIIGFEWTASGGINLHRNVLFSGGADAVDRTLPFSQYDSRNPEDLWMYLQGFEEETGSGAIAIPHNGNLSNGRMFSVESFNGEPLSAELAARRIRFEPLIETTQIKGDSESHPFLSPADEFAGYELWDKSSLDGAEPKTPDMLKYEYSREALKTGLKLESELGVNPYKFGMIGSTDSHTSLATAEEENFFGKHSAVEPDPNRWKDAVIGAPDPAFTTFGWQQAASGLAAVWASENTRQAIFDAMRRKETYATTGPRMTVRFFGGWDFTAEDALSRLPATAGYQKGVPMGGDLPPAPEGKSPTFLVAALKDPFSGNLDRIQIVKGWLDADGTTKEKVHDVAWSDERQPGPDGRLPPVGNTVDVARATWTNTIGDPELIAVWTDPEFDPALSAFYYAKVIEIPTPRWTAYDAVRFGVQMTEDVPMITQERAYTSPIWYTPER